MTTTLLRGVRAVDPQVGLDAVVDVLVEDGRIAERGTHEELMRQNGVYRRFIEIRERAEGWRIAEA